MNGDTLASGDYAFAYMATNALPPVIGMLFMICGLSATMSSGDSDAISGVTILLTDVYPSITGKTIEEKDYAKVSRVALICTLGAAFFITLFVNDVIGYISTIVGAFLPRRGCGYAAGPLLEACQLAGRSGLHRLRHSAGRADSGAAFLQELDQRHHGWSGCACYHHFSGVRHCGLSHVPC